MIDKNETVNDLDTLLNAFCHQVYTEENISKNVFTQIWSVFYKQLFEFINQDAKEEFEIIDYNYKKTKTKIAEDKAKVYENELLELLENEENIRKNRENKKAKDKKLKEMQKKIDLLQKNRAIRIIQKHFRNKLNYKKQIREKHLKRIRERSDRLKNRLKNRWIQFQKIEKKRQEIIDSKLRVQYGIEENEKMSRYLNNFKVSVVNDIEINKLIKFYSHNNTIELPKNFHHEDIQQYKLLQEDNTNLKKLRNIFGEKLDHIILYLNDIENQKRENFENFKGIALSIIYKLSNILQHFGLKLMIIGGFAIKTTEPRLSKDYNTKDIDIKICPGKKYKKHNNSIYQIREFIKSYLFLKEGYTQNGLLYIESKGFGNDSKNPLKIKLVQRGRPVQELIDITFSKLLIKDYENSSDLDIVMDNILCLNDKNYDIEYKLGLKTVSNIFLVFNPKHQLNYLEKLLTIDGYEWKKEKWEKQIVILRKAFKQDKYMFYNIFS